MRQKILRFHGATARVFFPEGPVGLAAYLPCAAGEGEAVAGLLDGCPAALVALEGVDWGRDLSPWPAPRAFRGGEDFAGGADRFLQTLSDEIIPAVESGLGLERARRAVAGYSLAGLFALYALWRCGRFHLAASISGSLWYDGFLDFMRDRPPAQTPERVYLSLGEREKHTKNRRLAVVEARTLEAERLLRGLGAATRFERNPGGHFDDAAARVARGLRWLADTNSGGGI